MARVQVTDPHSGATLTVDERSPQAKAWGERPARRRKSEPKAEPKKQSEEQQPE